MKFTLDTERKTIKIEENVCLGTFFQELTNYLPLFNWDVYTIRVENPLNFPTTGTYYNPNLLPNSEFLITTC